jgi:hypothetical protein
VKSYTTKPERVCGISLKFQPPNTHLHSFKTITRFPLYSPSFSQLLKLIILSLLKKLVGTSILKIKLKIMSEEEESSKDPSSPFKEKEKEGEGRSKAWWPKEEEEKGSHVWRSMEGKGEGSHAQRLMEGEGEGSHAQRLMEGQGESSHAWWPMMEGSKLGGQWKVKEKLFSLLFTFPPTNFI